MIDTPQRFDCQCNCQRATSEALHLRPPSVIADSTQTSRYLIHCCCETPRHTSLETDKRAVAHGGRPRMWTASSIALLLVSCATRVVTGSNELSGGADGRGWGGANAADECTLGITAQHPNPLGFRVTVRTWVRGTIVQWRFDEQVQLKTYWGPVRDVTHANVTSTLRFVLLRGFGKRPRRLSTLKRTDQWGFVLASPYRGLWRILCTVPEGPPPPSPAPPPRLMPPPMAPPTITSAAFGFVQRVGNSIATYLHASNPKAKDSTVVQSAQTSEGRGGRRKNRGGRRRKSARGRRRARARTQGSDARE